MNHLEVAIPGFPKDIDPRSVWSYYHYMLVQSIYSTLTRLNEEGNIVAQLAKRWSVSKDGKLVTIELLKNAKFQDGTKITTEDVAYSLSRHLWPNSTSVLKGYLLTTLVGAKNLAKGKVASGIKIKDPHTISIRLIKPYVPFFHLLAMPGFSIVKKGNPYVGSGPMLGSFDKKLNKWKLKKNISFFGKKTTLSSMGVSKVSGVAAIEKAFKNKEIDVILGVPIGDAEKMKLPSDVKMSSSDTLSYNHLFYNMKKGLFKNKEFRTDLGRLIQEVAWEKKFLSAYQEKLTTFIPQGVMPKSYYKRILDEISLQKFKKKWGSRISGKKLKFVVIELHFKSEFLDELSITLEKVGFKVKVNRIGGADFLKAIKAEDYDLISGPYIGNFADPDGFLEPLNGKSALKYGTHNYTKFFKDVDGVRFLLNPRKRLAGYSKVLRSLEDKWFFVPLYRMNFPIIHHKKLKIPDSSYRYEAELWNIFWNL